MPVQRTRIAQVSIARGDCICQCSIWKCLPQYRTPDSSCFSTAGGAFVSTAQSMHCEPKYKKPNDSYNVY
eukprot:2416789-Rhodomonas_salina.2